MKNYAFYFIVHASCIKSLYHAYGVPKLCSDFNSDPVIQTHTHTHTSESLTIKVLKGELTVTLRKRAMYASAIAFQNCRMA